jgi:hypothetical protein
MLWVGVLILYIMNIDFNELKSIVTERLEGQADINDFDNFWEKRTSQNDEMIKQWVGEALLNNYLRYVELKSMVTK